MANQKKPYGKSLPIAFLLVMNTIKKYGSC